MAGIKPYEEENRTKIVSIAVWQARQGRPVVNRHGDGSDNNTGNKQTDFIFHDFFLTRIGIESPERATRAKHDPVINCLIMPPDGGIYHMSSISGKVGNLEFRRQIADAIVVPRIKCLSLA